MNLRRLGMEMGSWIGRITLYGRRILGIGRGAVAAKFHQCAGACEPGVVRIGGGDGMRLCGAAGAVGVNAGSEPLAALPHRFENRWCP